ncbi:hypothetical protein LA345_12845 [Burkholderia vietnamiensis]|uniref:Uncharacterized protein n=1 Tax=Burkholderia vietnamiensis (strain G4 / LMG 22486) TaxID=269482 RepID=A4JFI6_BURVG|nr:hypothetical protein Bcep1808_2037 [Burkholderia vietnamiensis G4]MCB4344799.1 hypothetical protein [Burkholderia vietnamiensis]
MAKPENEALARLRKTRVENDKANLEDAQSSDGWIARLTQGMNDLVDRKERHEISNEEFESEAAGYIASLNRAKQFVNEKFSWARLAVTGWGSGLYWTLLAISIYCMSLPSTVPFHGAIAIVAGFLTIMLVIGGAIGGFAIFIRSLARWDGTMGIRTVFWAGPGLFFVIAAAIAAAIASPWAAMFIPAGWLGSLAFVLWLWCFVTLAPATLSYAISAASAKYAPEAADSALRGPNIQSADVKMRNMRAFGIARSRLHNLAPRALAVVTAIVLLVVGNTVAIRENPWALHKVDAAELQFQNPSQGQAVAQTLKARAQIALDAAQKSGAQVAPSWLQTQATSAPLPGGAVVGWGFGFPTASPTRVSLSPPAYYAGVYRPAGLWVLDFQPAARVERNALISGAWFIPFYSNRSCSALMPDFAARDKEWLRDNTTGSDRYDFSGAAWNSAKPFSDFAAEHATPEGVVECVGDPIAVKAPVPEVLAKSNGVMNPAVSSDLEIMGKGQLANLRALRTLADWSDFGAWRANGVSFGQALNTKLNKIELTHRNWKSDSN